MIALALLLSLSASAGMPDWGCKMVDDALRSLDPRAPAGTRESWLKTRAEHNCAGEPPQGSASAGPAKSRECAEIDEKLKGVPDNGGVLKLRQPLLDKRRMMSCPGEPPAYVPPKPKEPTPEEKAAAERLAAEERAAEAQRAAAEKQAKDEADRKFREEYCAKLNAERNDPKTTPYRQMELVNLRSWAGCR